MSELVETWVTHGRLNQYLLAGISEAGLAADMNGKGRTVFALFAHIHNVRLMWLKSVSPDLLIGLEKIEPKPIMTSADLKAGLVQSGQAIASLIELSEAAGGRVKGFKPHVTAFVGYLISHESHHRGQIEWALRMSGCTWQS